LLGRLEALAAAEPLDVGVALGAAPLAVLSALGAPDGAGAAGELGVASAGAALGALGPEPLAVPSRSPGAVSLPVSRRWQARKVPPTSARAMEPKAFSWRTMRRLRFGRARAVVRMAQMSSGAQ
jgi:hypothetical protein